MKIPKIMYLYFIYFVLAFALTGCGVEKEPADQDKPGEIIVFAAASLTESFNELAAEFEKLENGTVKVIYNFAGSQALKTSVENGAKADIFASASVRYMEELEEKGFVSGYSIFAQNRLVLIKNKNSSYSITKLGDLSAEGMKIAVGDESVPVGMYWEQALETAYADGELKADEISGIERNIKTRELNVKDVVSKVTLNEVDVGVVYKTDVAKVVLEKVEEIDLPVFQKFDSNYPAAVLKDSEGNAEALKFYYFLLSDKGSKILEKYNFITDK
jgi:molybdate transport system substrate-binding protein